MLYLVHAFEILKSKFMDKLIVKEMTTSLENRNRAIESLLYEKDRESIAILVSLKENMKKEKSLNQKIENLQVRELEEANSLRNNPLSPN